MTSSIGATGLIVDNAQTITTNLDTGFEGIYGNDINLDSNSPDGQRIGIFTQIVVDLLELLVGINNSFDPDQAVGTILDQRVAINNIVRQGGTYTVQPISITTNATVTLAGLDSAYNSATGTGYTVQDGSGNQFILANTTTLTAGTTVCNFRAATIGAVNVPINTITIPVTIVLGVISVNNPSSPITVGEAQETDAQLRTRRQQSPSINSNGYLNGLQAALLALTGVTEAKVYQNVTDSTDADGIPPHAIWVVIAGGANSDIGTTIYQKKSDGANMRGSQTFNVTTPAGTMFTAKWDVPTATPLYIAFTIKTTVAGFSFNLPIIKNYIAANLNYGIGAFAETSSVTTAAIGGIAAQGGGGVPVLMTISSDGITYTDYLASPTLASQWTVATANISITVI